MFGRFFIPAVRFPAVQPGRNKDAPSEAVATPVVLRNSLLLILSIIVPFYYLFCRKHIYRIDHFFSV
jgi:hypothetical protein